MKKKASGFYADSLEMLLDTMCNMLGGIVFIALMVALLAQDKPPPPPDYFRQQSVQLSNDLAAVAASNSLVEASLQSTLLRIQDPHQRFRTNVLRLPNLTQTTKRPWTVIVRYGKIYPLDLMPPARGARPAHNDRAVVRQPYLEPRAGQGDDPEQGVAKMVRDFTAGANTNFYFAFCVYEDSFNAFVRARDEAARLGFQYGWDPLPANQRMQLSRQGERILPQD